MKIEVRMRSAIAFAAVIGLLNGCTHDPLIRANYKTGETTETVLKGITTQLPHLYVVVNDEDVFRHRLQADLIGEMHLSEFIERFSAVAQLHAEYHPYEFNSSRGTLKVRSGAPTATSYAVVANGHVRIVTPGPR